MRVIGYRSVRRFPPPLGLAIAIIIFSPMALRCQFSPGPLSRAHHALEGPTHCTACHIGGGGERKLKCLSCHVEIERRLAANRGLHPSLLAKGRPDDQCARCHSEHNGESFIPTRWDVSLDQFDHAKTGYPLEGAHSGLACGKCHNPERITQAARREILMKDLRRSYLGLSRDCQSCHEDEHRGQLGNACERCHGVSKWKDATRFDHATAKFRLTGAHERVACLKCHPAAPSSDGGRPHVKFVGIAFAQCSACHKDVHQGAFAVACSSCHNDSSWKQPRNVTASFDHSNTKFPLAGRHGPVACDKCHRNADFKAPVAHDRCGDCHKDVHGGQFLSGAGASACQPARSAALAGGRACITESRDCAECHTVDGWKPTTFTVAAHAKSAYPLLGRHAAVACAQCHKPAGAATVYRVKFAFCADCHRDPHGGQFAKEEHRGANQGVRLTLTRCEDCHTVERFRPAAFTLDHHSQTRFPLRGAHAAVVCTDCHTTRPERPDVAIYRFADLSCSGCHRDPHQGQFDARMTAKNASGAPLGCQACHSDRTWRDLPGFDHSKTAFALSGAHSVAACDRCHRATPVSTGLRLVVFRDAPAKCEGCHEDVHGGQFAREAANAGCTACHSTGKWRPAHFDHNRTRFALTGAHANGLCRDCHKTTRDVNGKPVLFYKPTPIECSGCHGTNAGE